MRRRNTATSFLYHVFFFVLLWVCVSHGALGGTEYDRVIAKLNEEIILVSDLREILRERRGVLNTPDPIAAADSEIVKALLDRTLLLSAAKRSSAPVPDQEICEQVESMVQEAKSHYPSQSAFMKDVVEQFGSLEKFKRDLQRRATIDYKISRLVASRFTITDADIAEYERECKAAGRSPESYHLRRIGVPVDNETSGGRRQALARVSALLKSATAQGLSFSEAARRFTEIPGEKEIGGDLGYLPSDKLAPELRSAVANLSPGQVTEPLIAGNFACIFYLESKRGARSSLYEKRFLESREALLTDLRRKACLTVYDSRLIRKIPTEYQHCLQQSSSTHADKHPSSESNVKKPQEGTPITGETSSARTFRIRLPWSKKTR